MDNCQIGLNNLNDTIRTLRTLNIKNYFDVHAIGQQSTIRRLFTAVAMQRNNGTDQRFLWGPSR
jgi:hypothetical protein